MAPSAPCYTVPAVAKASSKPHKSQKVIRTGNSAAVTIPVEFMQALNLRIGDRVTTKLNLEKGTLTCYFPTNRQLKLPSYA